MLTKLHCFSITAVMFVCTRVKWKSRLLWVKIQSCCNFIEQVQMYYRSETGVRCCIGAGHTLSVRSPGRNTFLCRMTSWPPYWYRTVLSEILFYQSMCIYLKNNPAEFHPDPIWNDGTLGSFEGGCLNNNSMSNYVRSVSDLQKNICKVKKKKFRCILI